MECVTPTEDCTAHDFMNERSGALRKSYTEAFKLMHLLKFREHELEGSIE